MPSLKDFIDFTRTVLNLAEDQKKSREDIKELRKDLEVLSRAVLELRYSLDNLADHEGSEREKLVLEVRNALLEGQHRLVTVLSEKSQPRATNPKGKARHSKPKPRKRLSE